MGQIRKRGSVYWVRYYRNGKRYEESSNSTKWADADRLLKSREGDAAKGVPVSPAIVKLLFDDAAADLETEYAINARKSSDALKRRIALGLKPYFAGRKLASITAADIRLYIEERQKAGKSNATINRELSALKRMYSLARRAKRILADNVPHTRSWMTARCAMPPRSSIARWGQFRGQRAQQRPRPRRNQRDLLGIRGGQGRDRTADTVIFSHSPNHFQAVPFDSDKH